MMMRVHLSFLVLSMACCLAQPPATPGPKGAPVAVVDGKPILEDELSALVEGELRRLQFQEYQIRHRALENLIVEKLLAAQAREKGLTAEELLRQEVDEKVAEPSETELERDYADRQDLSNVPFEQVKNQLLPGLKQQNVARARQAYINRLRLEAHVIVLLQPPQAKVTYDPARVLGDPSAPVTIIEFADFQCPFCRKADATLKDLMKEYQGRVRLAYRDFPLTQIHPQAERAAEAARCGGEQGQFWHFHDLLFASPGRLSDADFEQHARTLGLDMTRFEACLREGKFRSQVDLDLKEGTQAGVDSTPGFFINGSFLSGAQPIATFEQIIDAELASVKK